MVASPQQQQQKTIYLVRGTGSREHLKNGELRKSPWEKKEIESWGWREPHTHPKSHSDPKLSVPGTGPKQWTKELETVSQSPPRASETEFEV